MTQPARKEEEGSAGPGPEVVIGGAGEVPPVICAPTLASTLGEATVLLLPYLLVGGASVAYAVAFILNLSPYWFDPVWTTDDALQQLFPFHKVRDPELFRGDFITRAMEGYLTPLHYWVTAGLTHLLESPFLASHTVQLVQLLLTCVFLGAGVWRVGGAIPAMFSVMWFLHTRHIVQRLTVGLVRGWAAPVLAGFFFLAASRRHKSMVVLLFLGCLAHPPATFVVAGAYGIFLLLDLADPARRKETIRPFLTFVIAAPFIAITALMVVKMPEEVGTMATYQEALRTPEFQRPGGRFPFVPLLPRLEEWHTFGFQAFLSKWVKLERVGKEYGLRLDYVLIWGVLALVGGLTIAGAVLRRRFIPRHCLSFGLAVVAAYELSRLFAFRLYVPNRHLQLPMAFFFIASLSVGVFFLGRWLWTRVGLRESAENWGGVGALAILSLVIMAGSGHGLHSRANFNWQVTQRGAVWEWLEENTEKDAMIASHPTFLDAVQLLAKRKGFATTETAHPFYDRYYARVKPRLAISLRAHYAKDLGQLYDITSANGIDYFIFERKRFYPKELAKASYFRPFDQLVSKLTSGPPLQYAYRELPREMDPVEAPYVKFRDAYSALVDIAELGKFLEKKGKGEVIQ